MIAYSGVMKRQLWLTLIKHVGNDFSVNNPA